MYAFMNTNRAMYEVVDALGKQANVKKNFNFSENDRDKIILELSKADYFDDPTKIFVIPKLSACQYVPYCERQLAVFEKESPGSKELETSELMAVADAPNIINGLSNLRQNALKEKINTAKSLVQNWPTQVGYTSEYFVEQIATQVEKALPKNLKPYVRQYWYRRLLAATSFFETPKMPPSAIPESAIKVSSEGYPFKSSPPPPGLPFTSRSGKDYGKILESLDSFSREIEDTAKNTASTAVGNLGTASDAESAGFALGSFPRAPVELESDPENGAQTLNEEQKLLRESGSDAMSTFDTAKSYDTIGYDAIKPGEKLVNDVTEKISTYIRNTESRFEDYEKTLEKDLQTINTLSNGIKIAKEYMRSGITDVGTLREGTDDILDTAIEEAMKVFNDQTGDENSSQTSVNYDDLE